MKKRIPNIIYTLLMVILVSSSFISITTTSDDINYESAGTPSVATNATTNVEETTATLNGYLSDDGGGCNVKFQYGTTISYGNNTTNQSKSTGDEFNAGISSLSEGTLYHCRAVATTKPDVVLTNWDDEDVGNSSGTSGKIQFTNTNSPTYWKVASNWSKSGSNSFLIDAIAGSSTPEGWWNLTETYDYISEISLWFNFSIISAAASEYYIYFKNSTGTNVLSFYVDAIAEDAFYFINDSTQAVLESGINGDIRRLVVTHNTGNQMTYKLYNNAGGLVVSKTGYTTGNNTWVNFSSIFFDYTTETAGQITMYLDDLNITTGTSTAYGSDETFLTTTQGEPPILTAELPTNGSTEIEMYPTLSITVNDPCGLNFNISWGTNVSGNWLESYQNLTCTNGTYTQTAVWANASATKYWWYVNATNTGECYTNETYHFTTDEYHWGTWSDWWQFNFSSDAPTNLVATGYNKTQINLTWTDGAIGADATVVVRNESGWSGTPNSPTNGTEIYNGSRKMTEYNNKDDDGDYNLSNLSQTFTVGTNGANLGFVPSRVRVKILNAWGTVTAQITPVNATGQPANDTVLASNSSTISGTGWFEFNFTTTIALNASTKYALVLLNGTGDWYFNLTGNYTGGDAYHYSGGSWFGPDGPNMGYMFEIYGEYFVDVALSNSTQYCYSAWSWNNTESNHSLEYVSDCGSTMSDIEVSNPYPVNNSIEVARPPTNCSVQVNGTTLDIYFYWYNMTPMTDAWQLVTSWLGQSTGRFDFPSLWSNGWVWGNTSYHWSVNVTNGVIWVNNSYTFTTIQLANGANARYDVSNDNWVDGTDLLNDYAHRTGEASYDGIYDVNNDDWIDGSDLLQIYANRS